MAVSFSVNECTRPRVIPGLENFPTSTLFRTNYSSYASMFNMYHEVIAYNGSFRFDSLNLKNSNKHSFRTSTNQKFSVVKCDSNYFLLNLNATENTNSNREQKTYRCEFHDLHNYLVPYSTAWEWQKQSVKDREEALKDGKEFPDTVMILQHNPVYTLGTKSSLQNIKFDHSNPPAEFYSTERGGEVTFHGPGQLVLYPIINLRNQKQDLHWYLRTLEDIVIRTLHSSCNIHAERVEGMTGVWAEGKKVAAIGVRVSKWITYHGLALNVCTDLNYFDQIIPCGLSLPVGSVSQILTESRLNQVKSKYILNGESDTARSHPNALHDRLMSKAFDSKTDQLLSKNKQFLKNRYYLSHVGDKFETYPLPVGDEDDNDDGDNGDDEHELLSKIANQLLLEFASTFNLEFEAPSNLIMK